MSLDLATLWNFASPAASEARFRAALAQASADDAIILQTQIARTYGLRQQFSQAQRILDAIEPQVADASPEARARYHLERGRTFCSATHPPALQTAEARDFAASDYVQSFKIAQQAALDSIAIDALHMLAFAAATPEGQLDWGRKAIGYMRGSTQPEAQRWAGALHNNLGYTLHQQGRYAEALDAFEQALAAHQQHGSPQQVRVARWMVAWTLRSLGQLQEALAMQLQLERDCDAAGEPDPYVFEELEQIYHALGNSAQADRYLGLRGIERSA